MKTTPLPRGNGGLQRRFESADSDKKKKNNKNLAKDVVLATQPILMPRFA